MARGKNRVDPFATISEKEVLLQEVKAAGKDAVKGEDKKSYTWQDSRNYSPEEIRQSWENHRAQKKIGPTRKEL